MSSYDQDKKWIIKRYNDRLDSSSDAITALASGSEKRREQRFKILTEVGDLNGKSVLDLGCGFGDFYDFLKKNNIECDYAGYDINPELIKRAAERYGEVPFKVIDVLLDEFPEFDYIVSSSAFNNRLKYEDNYQLVENILTALYSHARQGIAIDFMSSYVDYENPEGFYYQPETVFSLAKKISRRVSLRHDYPLFEFCVYLYPDQEFLYD